MKHVLLLLCLVSSLSTLSQAQTSAFSISGRVSSVIGQDTIPEKEAIVTIEKSGQVAFTDSAGAFRFQNLKPGIYQVKVKGNSFKDIDTTLVITNKSITDLNMFGFSTCAVNEEVARKDILQKNPRLLLASGIAPQAFSNKESFNRRFQVDYYDFGCDIPNAKCIIRYNQVVFKHLDKTYGRRWRQQVRRDVVGL